MYLASTFMSVCAIFLCLAKLTDIAVYVFVLCLRVDLCRFVCGIPDTRTDRNHTEELSLFFSPF